MSALLNLPLALILGSGGLGVAVMPRNPPQFSGPGTLESDKVIKVAAAHQAELKYCFLREAQRVLNEVEGRLVLSWRIGPDGAVQTARVVQGQTSIRNSAAVGCAVRQVLRWRFPRPTGGPVMVQQAWVVQLVDQPSSPGMSDPIRRTYSDPTCCAPEAAPKPREPCWVRQGPLDPAVLNALVREHHSQLSGCLAKFVADPKPPPPPPPDAGSSSMVILLDRLNTTGGLSKFVGIHPAPVFTQVNWALSATGTAQDVRVTRRDARSARAERCVAEELASWAFPPGKGDTSAVGCLFHGR